MIKTWEECTKEYPRKECVVVLKEPYEKMVEALGDFASILSWGSMDNRFVWWKNVDPRKLAREALEGLQ